MNEYEEFITSEDWIQLRDTLIEERGLECERCHQDCIKYEIRLHHKNYEKEFKYEDEKDLMLVCLDCHNELHQDLKFY